MISMLNIHWRVSEYFDVMVEEKIHWFFENEMGRPSVSSVCIVKKIKN